MHDEETDPRVDLSSHVPTPGSTAHPATGHIPTLGQAWASKVTTSSEPDVSVMGADVSQPPVRLTRDEWRARYKQRFIDVCDCDDWFAQACAEAESFETLSEFFEDDPEGAADEEMSCWDE